MFYESRHVRVYELLNIIHDLLLTPKNTLYEKINSIVKYNRCIIIHLLLYFEISDDRIVSIIHYN